MDDPGKTEGERGSFRAILKSSSLVGGASAVNILIGMVRTKFVAVLLGPAGVGLIGMYGQITGLVSTLAGMGIATSGVRQVAEAAGVGDPERIARTVLTLRRTAWATGLLGALGLAALAGPISRLTFGDARHAVPLAILGVTILMGSVSAGQSCLVQGTRRIADVARLNVLGALTGTVIAVPCYVLWGVDGVVVALVLAALAALATSWWYARRVPVASVSMTWRETWAEARTLLSLGVSFMGAGLVAAAATYLVQALLVRRFGMEGLGLYQAAYGLSGILAGFVLGAMAADYYPRLTGVAGDDASVQRVVNEQSQVATLLALPGLAAMMVFAPLVIRVFYAPAFEAAVPILRWCILGILGRVFSWPLGFVLLAKGRAALLPDRARRLDRAPRRGRRLHPPLGARGGGDRAPDALRRLHGADAGRHAPPGRRKLERGHREAERVRGGGRRRAHAQRVAQSGADLALDARGAGRRRDDVGLLAGDRAPLQLDVRDAHEPPQGAVTSADPGERTTPQSTAPSVA